MLEAALWGFLSGSSLIVGGAIALLATPRRWVVGLVMAFGAGALLSAVAYELVSEPAFEEDTRAIVFAMLLGSLTFVIGDMGIARLGGGARKPAADGEAREDATLGIVLGTVLDGIPESFVIGLSLVTGGGASVAFIGSVFMSNVPEALAATAGLRRTWPAGRILAMWCGIALISATAAALGYAWFESGLGETGTRMQAFAGGAILTMLADSMMPEAFEQGGRWAGVVTVLGFIAALALTLVA